MPRFNCSYRVASSRRVDAIHPITIGRPVSECRPRSCRVRHSRHPRCAVPDCRATRRSAAPRHQREGALCD